MSASCSAPVRTSAAGSTRSFLLMQGQPFHVGRRHASSRLMRSAPDPINTAERFADTSCRVLRSICAVGSPSRAYWNMRGAYLPKSPGFAVQAEFHQVVRLVAEFVQNGGGEGAARMNAVMHEQAFLQQALAEPCPAAQIGSRESPSRRPNECAPLPYDIGRAGAENDATPSLSPSAP